MKKLVRVCWEPRHRGGSLPGAPSQRSVSSTPAPIPVITVAPEREGNIHLVLDMIWVLIWVGLAVLFFVAAAS